MKLGSIGLGITGTPMTVNLMRADHRLHVITVGPIANELLPLDAVSAETTCQVTDASDIIFITMPDMPQVGDVLFDENGCTKASLKGKTIVDTSSVSPIETKRFTRQMNEPSGDYLDAPVSGSEIDVRGGTLSIIIGGDGAVFERVKPLFKLPGKNIILVGDNDGGQACKMTNQITVALNIEAVSEALLFASKTGVDPVRVHQALVGGFISLHILEVHDERMIKRVFNPGFKIALHQKDLNLALQSTKALALNLPNTATCQELFGICVADGSSQLDHSTLVQASELMTNHKLA